MRVLHLLVSNKFSGAENVVCTIIKCFENDIDMAYCSLDGPIRDVLNKRNIKFYGLKKINLRNVKKIIKIYKPDVIHAHDYTASVLASFSGFKGKIISHIHNNAPFAKTKNFKSNLYSLTIKKYSNIVGVSNKIYEEAIFKNKMKDKFKTIYNYIDKQNILDLSLEPNTDKYDIYFIGRLTEPKNPFLFIEIVKRINKNIYAPAVMIGEGPLYDECQRIINEQNLKIKLIGFKENPYCIIKNCKLGIMPSAYEGFGLTALESLILNKPVLNSGVGGLSEVFKFNQELICKDIDDYVLKALEILNEQKEFDFSKSIERFTSKLDFKDKIRKLYK